MRECEESLNGNVPAGEAPRLLIADDDPNVVNLLRHIMEREGFSVLEAYNGERTCDLAAQYLPDLILLDVQMPGMDGFEVVKRLRADENTSHIPVIVITAAAKEPEDVVLGLGLGADDYVLKPFMPRELVARVRAKLRARMLEKSLQRRTAELEALVRIGSTLNARLDLDEVVESVLHIACDELGADYGMLQLLDEDGRPILSRHTGGGDRAPSFEAGPLLELEPGLITSCDAPDGLVRELLGDRFTSAAWAPFVHRDVVLGLLILFRNGRPFDEHELRFMRSVVEQAALAIRNAELYDKLRHYATNLEEMVEARTVELKEAQQQLVLSEKLAALGRISAGIAHEVNNPLQSIRNCLELALEDLDAGRPVDREMLQVAERDVKRIAEIVTRMLDFARPSRGGRAKVDVSALVSDVLSLVRKQLEHSGVRVERVFGDVPPVVASADQLKQVFLNMVLNAIAAMPDGGTLRIETGRAERHVFVRFEDSGCGIPPDAIPHIFEPFYSTRPDGTGLGLAISHSLIEAHNGRIEVESEVGRGTVFTILLPLHGVAGVSEVERLAGGGSG